MRHMLDLLKNVLTCEEGSHDWRLIKVETTEPFLLVSKYKCKKCGKTKTETSPKTKRKYYGLYD